MKSTIWDTLGPYEIRNQSGNFVGFIRDPFEIRTGDLWGPYGIPLVFVW